MAKHSDIYQEIAARVGLKEDQEYKDLYNPNDIFGESLGCLALRNFKRFVAVLYYLINNKNFDLIIFGGDSGVGLSKVTEMVYEQLGKKSPMIIYLPVIRWKPKWLNYTGQTVKRFDNSIFIPQIKDKVNSLEKLENLVFIDDEIANGITAKAIVSLVLGAIDDNKLVKPVNLTIVAEDQDFNPEDFLENVNCDFYPFATQTKDIFNVLSYIVPWNIEKQIREHFNGEEMGSKIILNSLLGLPSKEFERFPEYIIEKPQFTDKYIIQLKKEIPNFTELQKKFEKSVNKWIQEVIKEYTGHSMMNIEEFKKEKIEAREQLLNKIVETLKKLKPVAIHQFGSGVNNYKDEFSDLDLWVTFADDVIKEMVAKREEIFASVDPILIKSDAPQNAPMGGTYTLVIYDLLSGLYHVDYYLSPKSGNKVRTDAMLLFGNDSLPRGEWILDREAKGAWRTDHVFDQALAMTFILNKAIIRGGWNEAHADYIRSVYKDYGKVTNRVLPLLPEIANFEFIKQLYNNLAPYANEQQKKAIEKLKDYTHKVEEMYGSK